MLILFQNLPGTDLLQLRWKAHQDRKATSAFLFAFFVSCLMIYDMNHILLIFVHFQAHLMWIADQHFQYLACVLYYCNSSTTGVKTCAKYDTMSIP